jgi:hypothetical protein
MREKLNLLIKSCATWTVPATEIRSIGLPADALVPCFFALHLDYFIMTQNHTSIYRDWYRSDNFIMTRNYFATYRDWQKTRHLDTDAN